MSAEQARDHWRSWMAVTLLGVAAFTVVTTELAPIGMLSGIAGDLGQTLGRTGMVVTAYAWIGAVAALLAVLTINNLSRRPLLVGLMLLLALSNGVAAASNSFGVLMLARLVGALAHGAFWAMVGTLGAQLVSAHRLGTATAIIFGGVSVASVVGVPLVNVVSNHANWRAAFACLGLLALVTGVALAVLLPRMSGSAPLRRTQLASVLGNPGLRRLYVVASGAIMAHFATFTYVEALLSSQMNISPAGIAICLFVFGTAGVVGNLLCGALIDRQLKRMLASALLVMTLCMLAIGWGHAEGIIAAIMLVLGWGMAVAVLFVGIQSWVIRLAGDAALPASAIYAAIFNGAIGTGALAGAGVLEAWGVGTLCAGMAAVMGICFVLVTQLRAAKAVHGHAAASHEASLDPAPSGPG